MAGKLIPHNLIQRAVMQAMSQVIERKQNGYVSDTAYASAFFKLYFGKRIPQRNVISPLVTNKSLSKDEIMQSIHRFIDSNGQYRWGICESFAFQAFPSLKTQQDDRHEAHCDLKWQQSKKVSDKRDAFKMDAVEECYQGLLSLSNKALSEWVSSNEHWMSQDELKQGLKRWFDRYVDHSWTFNELYATSTPGQVAYDLSFDDVKLKESVNG
ncbi:hypothetical protein JCM19235_1351 [Vibrio maritimus]|uniref:Uncharacterized protein n=1 Tax=Vibrio maritimus TaxID=990268 RepID=A0A090S5R9_9VIBR|nr:hypothetical protein JCM19235_1351 [Vibrio maritimus]